MSPKEQLWSYCQLIVHGYSHEEANEIIEKIKRDMKSND